MLKYCLECQKPIDANTKQRKDKVYCNKLCNKYFNRKKAALNRRLEKRKANLRLNHEFRYLVSQCRRAKTIQILHGHTLPSFIDTMNLVKSKPKGDVELCHIAPVKGHTSIGLFHSKNLFYGGKYQNRQFGNKYIGGGASIAYENLLPRWDVSNAMTADEILVKIEAYLSDILPDYMAMCGVRKSRKVSIVQKIMSVEPAFDFDTLMECSGKSLAEQWGRISRTRVFCMPVSRESKFIAYLDGISRFITYNSKNRLMLKSIRRTMVLGYLALSKNEESSTYNKDFYSKYGALIIPKYERATLKNSDSWSTLKDLIYDTAFFALSGGIVDAKKFRQQLKTYLRFSIPPA